VLSATDSDGSSVAIVTELDAVSLISVESFMLLSGSDSVGAVNIVKIARIITTIVLIFPFMYLLNISCHFGIGTTKAVVKMENILEKLGKKTNVDKQKKAAKHHNPIVLNFFICISPL
jgi:hypothetical protein